jgi:hypothetical protein
VLGHQIGDELRAAHRLELVGLAEGHAEEAARHPVPEGRDADLVDHPAQFGQGAVGKARAVHRHEEVAAARQQRSGARRPFGGVQEQPADLAAAIVVGDQCEHLAADGAGELAGIMGEGVDAIGVMRAVGADAGEDLAGAAHLAGVQILQHEHIHVADQIVALAGEGGGGAVELVFQLGAVGGQVGEAAAGAFGHFIDGGQIVLTGGSQDMGHGLALAGCGASVAGLDLRVSAKIAKPYGGARLRPCPCRISPPWLCCAATICKTCVNFR